SIQQRMKEAGVSAALKSSNIRVVDPARAPTSPSKPNIPRNLLLGVLFGIVLGVGLAFGVEVMDNTVRTPEQVQTVSALPALGIVPMSIAFSSNGHGTRASKLLKPGGRSRVEIISHSHPKSEIAESYRALRTSILLSSLGAPPQVILVTSALPQEGKTTTAVNSAIVLAQQGSRVLLVDADLRRPSIHSSLGLRTKGGLSTLLTGSNQLEQVMVRSPQISRLFVLPAGPTPPQPAELLSSQLMKEFLKNWREQFDHIVIDTPPALSVTDAVALSVVADSVILVIRSGATSKEALRRARDLLLRVNARVTGVVVNAADLRAPDMHHYYYSGGNYASHYYDDSTTQKNR
ncbi:MAG TPA: polysaccharide biosynthesis tyrosine autokinase, partial [Terriglobales bacterium]|nr:polysaccharide biosynthesis tyrosine autokinase [Terriglobales bacterium]